MVASTSLAMVLVAQAIVLQERFPLAFLLSTPTGEVANISSSETIRMVSEIIDQRTNFFLQIAEAQTVTDCRGRLACLVRQSRPDYNREGMILESGTLVPFSEHIRDLQQRKAVYPRFMLILSNVTLPGQADRLSAVMIDTDIALEYFHSASREDPEWERDTDARINEYAVVFGPQRAQVKSPAEAQKFVRDLFSEGLGPVLEKTNHWEPYGTVELNINAEGVGINLDGVSIGTTRKGLTRLEKVTSGPRRLSFDDPAFEPYSTELVVERNQIVRADIDLRRKNNNASFLRDAVFWGGSGMVVLGTGLAVWSAARSDSSVSTYCFDAPGAGCRAQSQFQSLNYDAAAASMGKDPNPDGLLLAPFGYSIAITGLAFALGTYLLGDDTDVPWIPLVAGVALGAASYGLSAALNPQ